MRNSLRVVLVAVAWVVILTVHCSVWHPSTQAATGTDAEPASSERSERIALFVVSTKDAYGVDDDMQRIQELFDAAKDELAAAKVDVTFERPIVRKGVRSRNELFNLLQGVIVTDSTTLVCYCKLHGELDAQKRHVMYLDGYTDASVYRADLLRELTKRNARLTILITDSCSAVVAPSTEAATQAAVFPVQLFRDLFVESRDIVDINSSSEGQRAWMDFDGGLFTRAFTDLLSSKPNDANQALYEKIDKNKNGRYSWAEFFPVLTMETDDRYRRLRKTVLDTNLTPGGLPAHEGDRDSVKAQEHQFPRAFSQLPDLP